MLAKKYPSKAVNIINQFTGIYTLEFKSLGSKYKYVPGQFLHLALDEDYDRSSQWPDSRCFSMQSNSNEETIRITYAVKGGFTKQMEEQLKVGSEVWLKLPYGDLFTQPHNKTNTVFIAGGTGITPFLSLFTHKSFDEYINPKIYLGFRSKEFNIYRAELDRMIQLRSNLLVPEISHPEFIDGVVGNSFQLVKSYYENENGIIDIQNIFNENGSQSNYFISGPPPMIKSFKNALLGKGVPPNHILTDDWE